MDKLKSTGGISPELMEEAKAAMLAENMNYAEAELPSVRSGSGYPSMGGFIEQHFDFTTCQRGDGSYYGTGGTCRKGSEVKGGAPEKEKAAKKSSGGGGAAAASGGGDSAKAMKSAVAGVKKGIDHDAKMKAAGEIKKINPEGGAKVEKHLNEIKGLEKQARDASKKAGAAMAELRQDPQNQGLKDKLRVATAESRNARDMVGFANKRLNKTLKEVSGGAAPKTATTKAAGAVQRERSDRAARTREAKKKLQGGVKEKDKRAKDLNKEADRLASGLKKQREATKKNPTKENKAREKEMYRQTRAADQAAKKADREADKAQREFEKALKAAEKGGASWANFFK